LIKFKRTLIVEQSREYVVQIRDMLKKHIDEVEYCYDGRRALEIYRDFRPDLVLVEVILPKLDGFAFMENLLEDDILKIMLTSINQNIIIKKAFDVKADYLFVKPYDEASFVPRLLDVARHKAAQPKQVLPGFYQDETQRLRSIISDILDSLGIPVSMKGYHYLREALVIVHDDFAALGSLRDNIYEVLAKQFNTTYQCIERNMRHAIETSIKRADDEAYEQYFGNSLSSESGRPTNGEFIASLADKIRLLKIRGDFNDKQN